MGISVLISAFRSNRKSDLLLALKSIWHDQDTKPDQIVLVLDGPLRDDLYDAVNFFKVELGSAMTVVELSESKGLAIALNYGLAYCNHEYIARMDTDDISLPTRFSNQIEYLIKHPEVDVVGSWISEINDDGYVTRAEVRYPESHIDCFRMFSSRVPIAHPTAMFRKSFFQKVKSYPTNILLEEDTLLWYEGFLNGCIFSNIQTVTLQYRRSRNFFAKRLNFKKTLQLLFWRIFIINRKLRFGVKADFLAIAYFAMTFLPSVVKRFLYQHFR
jgi:glycosyltransferase involved in cell wall biosynthesis